MNIIGTTEMIARVALESDVEFRNINYSYLLVYLYMVLGEEVFRENGLEEYIPVRTNWKDSKARSLSSQINRDMKN